VIYFTKKGAEEKACFAFEIFSALFPRFHGNKL
jgi:hypothetical protein